jgi:hypothetical protein
LMVSLAGCVPCPHGPWGDDKGTPEVELVARTLAGEAELISGDGAQVDLTFPVQGGHVLFLGARVKNLAACKATLGARLIDPGRNEIAAEEKRTVAFSVAAGDGYGMSDVSDTTEVANVPACPNILVRDMVDAGWTVELSVVDATGRSAIVRREVVPVCRQEDPYDRALCRCECRGDYSFGRCSDPLDAGW